ncbi:MAG: hypothetical protein AB7H90_01245 [Alphaproteobacteria bacterium]
MSDQPEHDPEARYAEILQLREELERGNAWAAAEGDPVGNWARRREWITRRLAELEQV